MTAGIARIHDDWSTPAFSLAPIAPDLGPFPHRPFLEAVWAARTFAPDRLALAEAPDGLVALAIGGGSTRFVGEADLTDYHAPLGPRGSALLVTALEETDTVRFEFDSLPAEAADEIANALGKAGFPARTRRHASTAVLDLPETFDGWLSGIGKRQRHEVRRKRRRFIEEIGNPEIGRHHDEEALLAFFAMHRRGAGPKGRFMTPKMEGLFRTLSATANAVVHTLTVGGIPVASVFGFERGDGYFLYNAAYDPGVSHVSPGIVLLAALIEDQIARGASVFDFLKGDEEYKLRLGARLRPLFVIEGSMP